MNHQTSIDLFRRQIQEVTEDQFSDEDITKLLNAGIHRLQGDIQKVDPFAFLVHDVCDIVEGQDLYPWPAGFNYELAMFELDDSTDLYTKRIWPVDFEDAEANRTATTADEAPASGYVYSRHGTHFRLKATPEADLADGILLMSVETLNLVDLTDVSRIKVPLHWGYILYAKIIALGE